jgi:hypothetical protein
VASAGASLGNKLLFNAFRGKSGESARARDKTAKNNDPAQKFDGAKLDKMSKVKPKAGSAVKKNSALKAREGAHRKMENKKLKAADGRKKNAAAVAAMAKSAERRKIKPAAATTSINAAPTIYDTVSFLMILASAGLEFFSVSFELLTNKAKSTAETARVGITTATFIDAGIPYLPKVYPLTKLSNPVLVFNTSSFTANPPAPATTEIIGIRIDFDADFLKFTRK